MKAVFDDLDRRKQREAELTERVKADVRARAGGVRGLLMNLFRHRESSVISAAPRRTRIR